MYRALILLVVTGCGRLGFDGFGGDGGPGGDDAPGGGDGSVTDMQMLDATISPSCGTTVIIDDDFTTVGNGPFTPVNMGSYVISETGGVLRINVPLGTGGNTRAAMQQTASQSFAGTCAIAELSMSGSAVGVRAYLRLGLPAKFVQIYVENGQLYASNGAGTAGPVAYNAQAMRFLRLRHIGNQNYAIEHAPTLTGPFGSSGALGGSSVDPSPSSIELGVAAVMTPATATTVEFERVLLLGP